MASEDDLLNTPAAQRLFAPGKKRVLSLDGGGTRGIITIAFLREMEKQLREATGNSSLVLSDVFDMVAGTSVGSMLATMVALGKETEEIERVFRELAPKIFKGRETLFKQRRFHAGPLVNGVRSIVKDARLGSPDLKIGLTIVTKRLDTGSTWVLSNNPRMPYFADGESWDGNRHYKLESLIRASTAAPFLFTPTKIEIYKPKNGPAEYGWFVDGGVSPHNNPSYMLLLMAGLPAYKLDWKLTPQDLMMISVGTGLHRTPIDMNKRGKAVPSLAGALLSMVAGNVRDDIEAAALAASSLRSIINDNSMLVLKTMQALSCPRFRWKINSEIGSIDQGLSVRPGGDLLPPDSDKNGLLKYQRYDLPMEYMGPGKGLVPDAFDVEAPDPELRQLEAIDEPKNIDKLYHLASNVAAKQVSMADFEGFI